MLFTIASALAHQPFVVSDTASAPESAFVVEEPEVSIVVYAEPTCDEPNVWLTLDAEPGDEVFFQLGIPVADALDDWRPRVALVAPGLPEVDLGFPLPEGTGAVVYTAAADPTRFDEPFTGTSSWILVEEEVTLPEGGPAWLVAWSPDGTVARLWVAVGTVERFGDEDWARIRTLLDDVSAFHGTDGSEVPGPTTCEVAVEEAEDDGGDAPVGGCATAPVGVGAWALGLLVLVRRRAAGVHARRRDYSM